MYGPAAPTSGGLPTRPKPHLLVAEDQFSLGVFLAELLSGDYEVEVATNGEQAWLAAQREAPDLLLADVNMPLLDGVELTRRLRQDPRLSRLPILLFSGNNAPATLRRVAEAGADGFLAKPFKVPELLASLRAVAARRSGVD